MKINRRAVMGLLLATGMLAGCDVRVGVPTETVYVGNTYEPAPYFDPAPSYTYASSRSGRNPVIQSYTANPSNSVPQGQPITFQVVAYDATRDVLQYNWSATGGTLSTNSGQVVSWIPPTKPGVYTVMVTVANSSGGFVMGSLNLVVQDDGSTGVGGQAPKGGVIATPTPPPSATPTPISTPAASAAPEATSTPAPTPAPKAKGTVWGVVKDTEGAAIAGATVTLLAADQSFEGSVFTDTEGKFTFTTAPAGISLTLAATKAGYDKKERKISVVADTEANIGFEGANALKKQ